LNLFDNQVRNIRLLSLKLRNFKGVKSFDLITYGLNASVFGGNGTGKTTLYDAFLWLLFDKDSTNRKDFSVKTHDSDGNEIHGLEHSVEAILDINGTQIILRKMLAEKWTKKRGEAEKEFTGHETSYWVDDVPVKKNEYVSKINDLINENIFKLITNPFFFNNMLKWEERRKILLEISGNVSDLDVIRSDAKLAKLEQILAGKSVDDYKKIFQERIRKLNQEIEKIPVRIDELVKSIGEEQDYTAVEASLRHYKDQLNAIEAELANATNLANEFRKKQQQLFKLQTDIEARKKVLDEQANAGFKRIIDEKNQLLNQKYKLESEAQAIKSSISLKERYVKDIDAELIKLREQWHTENAKTFTHTDAEDFVCPTCNRPFPEEYIENQISELKANFERSKANALESINAKGKSLKENKVAAESEIASAREQLFNIEANLREINERITEIDKELSKTGPLSADYEQDAQYRELQAAYQALKAELVKPVEDTTKELLLKKSTIVGKIEDLNRILSQKEVVAKTRERIQELKDEERQLAAQISELEGHRYLIEQFIKAKVNLLEDSINSRFKAVRFKLFDTQINGGVVECCETLINTNGSWVPWADANNAGRVNAGLDIINTLTKHYGISAPIFIDNRESVNELIKTESQIINLVVTQDPKLRVEVER
jgi:DNA repair exonuclease SbcCD ATPase subunit